MRRRSFSARLRGLAPRLAATLALALIPVGLIAVLQSARIDQEIDRRQEATLLALTADAAAGEVRVMTEARGAVRALLAQLTVEDPSSVDCSAYFHAFVETNRQYSFAGFVSANGILACASDQAGKDVSTSATFLAMSEQPATRILVSREAAISKTSVIVVATPYFVDGDYSGYVAVSIPHSRLSSEATEVVSAHPLDLVTFNSNGDVLSSEAGLEDVVSRLPKNRLLTDFVGKGQLAFTGPSNTGEVRTFAITPILPGQVYALGSWPDDALALGVLPAWVFPAIMLIVGLIVAWVAADRFVIRHIRVLQRRMEAFASTRELGEAPVAQMEPSEIRSIYQTWQEIAQNLLMDEAELEGALKEKNVLLKEVHHRVKNNLQLIASIVSMKLRRARSPDARNVLKEVQMRVMSIASVHRSLYISSDQGKVRADELLRTVVDATIEAGAYQTGSLVLHRDYQPVVLFPDQAVPLSLFASEAVTNALKYVGRRQDGFADINVDLVVETADRARLTIANSLGVQIMPAEDVSGSGLGSSLLQAFAQQMHGEFTAEKTDDTYTVSVSFLMLPFSSEPSDGHLADDEDDEGQAAKP